MTSVTALHSAPLPTTFSLGTVKWVNGLAPTHRLGPLFWLLAALLPQWQPHRALLRALSIFFLSQSLSYYCSITCKNIWLGTCSSPECSPLDSMGTEALSSLSHSLLFPGSHLRLASTPTPGCIPTGLHSSPEVVSYPRLGLRPSFPDPEGPLTDPCLSLPLSISLLPVCSSGLLIQLPTSAVVLMLSSCHGASI